MRPASALAALALLAPILAGCTTPEDEAPDVLASFYPLEFLAREITGGAVSVGVVAQPGVEPHDYEPTPNDLKRVSGAKLVLLQGAGFEGWIETVRQQAPDARIALATDGLPLRDNEDPEEAAELPKDPHTWLDPLLYAQMARRVQDALNETFPDRRDAFTPRADALVVELHRLHADLDAGLAQCATRVVVTNHDAFGYLGARYNLTLIPILGLDPESEPDPQTLARVAEEARRHNVTVVYFEELASPRVAEALAREIGARTQVLSPVEGIPPDEPGATYLTKMRDNLAALREGMRCQ